MLRLLASSREPGTHSADDTDVRTRLRVIAYHLLPWLRNSSVSSVVTNTARLLLHRGANTEQHTVRLLSSCEDVCSCAGLLEGRRAGWPLFRGKELEALSSTHTVRILGACRAQVL